MILGRERFVISTVSGVLDSMTNELTKDSGTMGSEHHIASLDAAHDIERTQSTVFLGSMALIGSVVALGLSAGLARSGAVAVVICASTLLVAFNFALLGHLTRSYARKRHGAS